MSILIIEDDSDINELLIDMFILNGYCVKSAYSGSEGLIYLKEDKYDIILLDLMIPGKSGEEVLKYIVGNSNTPVIIISAKEEVGIKSKLLRLGADDFISKPFDTDEVLARIEACLRRCKKVNNSNNENIIIYKEINMDLDKREVSINKIIVNLTAREFDILELMVKNPSKVFSKANLFKSVWGEDYICDDNTITVHISNLRSKLIKIGAKKEYIKTIWAVGYRLEC